MLSSRLFTHYVIDLATGKELDRGSCPRCLAFLSGYGKPIVKVSYVPGKGWLLFV